MSGRPFGPPVANLFTPKTQEEVERRRGHLMALLLVAIVLGYAVSFFGLVRPRLFES